MENNDALVLIAELAVAIAGFSGVIVALESRSVRSWTPLQRRNLRLLLQVSAVAIFFSLLPLLLQRFMAASDFWKWALGFYGLVHVGDVSSFLIRQPTGAPLAPVYAGLAVALTQLSVAAFGSVLMVEAVYLGVLVWHLAIASMGFALLVWGAADQDTAVP